jgi:capsular polysaccharide export protein
MVLTAHSSDDLDKALAGINTFVPDEKLRLNFLAYLQNEYLVKGDWRHADQAHLQQVAHRLESFAP